VVSRRSVAVSGGPEAADDCRGVARLGAERIANREIAITAAVNYSTNFAYSLPFFPFRDDITNQAIPLPPPPIT
jgi:hypothetical protein